MTAPTLPRSVEHLAADHAAGRPHPLLLFWGHRASPDGGIAKSCLSNWWPAPFRLDGHDWPTVEHYMMHAKATLFGDAERAAAIRAAPSPKAAKALGRKVRPYGDLSWAAHRYDAVRRACVAKFDQDRELRAFLLGTAPKILVEASPHDRVWGIGLRESAPEAHDPTRWRGANLLGFALVDAREELAAALADELAAAT